ncbi:YceK/YidQ family lipoprotein [Pseudomonas sp. NFXW11]|uniref:hypothetical protein n=1 Tax=Pseudomonas sp. NFXW11 TaxID=2819531 RepID=UPI003CE68A4E
MARSDMPQWRDDRYYRATKTNAQILTGYGVDYGRMVTGGCWALVVCPILLVASLPLDAAVDTLLLPYDAAQPERPRRDLEPKPEYPLDREPPPAT